MPDPRTESRTFQCARDQHQTCAHSFGIGGGFNPKRLRLEFGVALCNCSCHASCPLTLPPRRLTVPEKTWYETCTCPGAAVRRQAMSESGVETPDFGKRWEEARDRSRARKEAASAVRSRIAGRSRAEIRDMYVAELQARELRIPSDVVLDAVVDSLTGNPLPAARLGAESLIGLGRSLHDVAKLFRQDH